MDRHSSEERAVLLDDFVTPSYFRDDCYGTPCIAYAICSAIVM